MTSRVSFSQIFGGLSDQIYTKQGPQVKCLEASGLVIKGVQSTIWCTRRCRANVAHLRQSRPDFGLGSHVDAPQTFYVVPSSRPSEAVVKITRPKTENENPNSQHLTLKRVAVNRVVHPPLSGEYGTNRIVEAGLWPWLSGKDCLIGSDCSHFTRKRNPNPLSLQS